MTVDGLIETRIGSPAESVGIHTFIQYLESGLSKIGGFAAAQSRRRRVHRIAEFRPRRGQLLSLSLLPYISFLVFFASAVAVLQASEETPM
jgi:hypothetical protein